jgi:hypothetical protein
MNLRLSLMFVFAGCGAVLLGSAWASPALADARQDVLSASQRCSGIADDRAWLDCYYGAAQPMRGRLGLPAAPAGQIRLVPPAMGAYAPQQQQPLYGVPAGPTYTAPSYPAPAYPVPAYGAPAPRVASAAPAPPPMPRRHNEGFFSGVFGNSKPVVANIRMASYDKNRDGKFTVTLADGEVWEQDVGDESYEAWRAPPARLVVNVYDGALGSYNMEVSDDSHLYKVHRIK